MDTGNQEGIGQIWLLQYLVLDGLLWIIFLTTTILWYLVRFRIQFNHTFILSNKREVLRLFFPQILPPSMHKFPPPFINLLQNFLLLVDFILTNLILQLIQLVHVYSLPHVY